MRKAKRGKNKRTTGAHLVRLHGAIKKSMWLSSEKDAYHNKNQCKRRRTCPKLYSHKPCNDLENYLGPIEESGAEYVFFNTYGEFGIDVQSHPPRKKTASHHAGNSAREYGVRSGLDGVSA